MRTDLPTVHSRILLIALVPLLIFALVFIVFGTIQPYQRALESFEKNGRETARYIADASELGMFYNNPETLEVLAQSALERGDIRGLLFLNLDGERLLQRGEWDETAWTDIELNDDFVSSGFFPDGDLWYFSSPIQGSSVSVIDYEEDEAGQLPLLGQLILVISIDEMRSAQRELGQKNAIFLLFGLLAAVMLSMRLSRAITRPVYELSRSAQAVAAGDFTPRNHHHSLQEMETLGHSFNFMAERISQHSDELYRQINAATKDLQKNAEVLEQHNQELEQVRSDLISANRAKDEFLAHMSHELRTPLTTIIGFEKLLNHSDLDEKQREHLYAIYQSSKFLLAIIDDILEVSKLQANRLLLDAESFDLVKCVENAVTVHSHEASSKGLELVLMIEPDVPRHIIGDATRLRQIFNNLISNAIKFTGRGEVIVTLALERVQDEIAVLCASIRDTGIGVSTDKQETLFEPFIQGGPDISLEYGGTGLGLAISKRLVNAMGGDIAIESEEGKGARIDFSFQAHLSDSADTNADLLPVRNEALLLCDKHHMSRLATRNILLNWTCHVTTSDDFEQALEYLSNDRTYYGLLLGVSRNDATEPTLRGLLERVRDVYSGPILLLMPMDAMELIVSGDLLESFPDVVCHSRPAREERILNYLDGLEGDEKAGQERITGHPLQGLCALVAEDNDFNRSLIVQLLEYAGAECVDCKNGLEAIEEAEKRAFDVILMDMQMPEMGGIEATRKIHLNSALNAKTPVIGLTANVLPRDKNTFREAGAWRVMEKPLDEDELYSLLSTLAEAKPVDNPCQGFIARHVDPAQLRQEIDRLLIELQRARDSGSTSAMYDSCHQLLGLIESCAEDKGFSVNLRHLHDALQTGSTVEIEFYYEKLQLVGDGQVTTVTTNE